jgi:hypothetical protein
MRAERSQLGREGRAVRGGKGQVVCGVNMIKIYNMQILKCHNKTHYSIKLLLLLLIRTRKDSELSLGG